MRKNKKNKGRKNKTGAKAQGGTITTTTKTPVTQTGYVYKCHNGNTKIYKEPDGGTLYIGGWGNGASFDWNTHVIDLTGIEHKYWDMPVAYDDTSKDFLPFLMQSYAGWLSLPFPDYGTPAGLKSYEQWVGIKDVIQKILRQGHDVLVACQGGHGRSGLFCAIVGYMLNINSDRSWSSPVEHLRKIHCDDAVETYAQEKFVYDVLGLNIKIVHSFGDNLYTGRGTGGSWQGASLYDSGTTSFKSCPICHTESLYVDQFGMCLTCKNRYDGEAPTRDDLTAKDIEHRGEIDHFCDDEKCLGIWTAAGCGHTVHNQIIYEGLCEYCYTKAEEERLWAEQKLQQKIDEGEIEAVPTEQYKPEVCTLCGRESVSSEKFGICFDCSSKLVQGELVDDVHNTITDPYRYISHKCDDEHLCVGIVRADRCQHVIHNREVEDGLCPVCYDLAHRKEEAQ